MNTPFLLDRLLCRIRSCRCKSKIQNLKSKICCHVERLEERLALAGFGPEDGSYLIEPEIGGYAAVQVRPSDQKIVAGGNDGRWVYNAVSQVMAVRQYDAAGNTDATFGSAGKATIPTPAPGYLNGSASSLVLQQDGKVVIAGVFTQSDDWDLGVTRLTASGQVDATFGNGGRTIIDTHGPYGIGGNEVAQAVGLQSTGKVVVAGWSFAAGYGVTARVTASGALDKGKNGFGDVQKGSAVGYHLATEISNYKAWGTSRFDASVVAPDDKIIAVGTHSNGAGQVSMVLARYMPNGAVDTTLNAQSAHKGWVELLPPAGFSQVQGREVTLQADGKIVVAGTISGNGNAYPIVARYQSNGALDTTFGAGSGYVILASIGISDPTGLVIQPDGKIVLSSGMSNQAMVVRLSSNGQLDSTFGGTGYKTSSPLESRRVGISGVALQADGSIVVCGSATVLTANENSYPLLMRFYGDNAPTGGAATSAASSAEMDAALMLFLDADFATPNKRK